MTVPAVRAPPCRSTGSRSRAKSRDIQTFLSVLGEQVFQQAAKDGQEVSEESAWNDFDKGG